MKVAIILISESSLPIARTLSNEFPDSEIITTTPAPDCTYVSFYEEFMALSFHRYDAFIFIGAMGICVRTIAPHVKDKHTDPAVICVDSTGLLCRFRPLGTHRKGQRNDRKHRLYSRR